MSTFTFPQPGERQNASAIPIPDDVLTFLLSATGALIILEACDDPACDACVHKGEMWQRGLSLVDLPTIIRITEYAPKLAAQIRERVGL